MTAAISAPTSTTGSLKVNGTDVVTFDSTGIISGVNKSAVSQQATLGTTQNTTAGTSIDFTGIPSWVKRITVSMNGVSTNGTSQTILQLGKSAGVETTGYTSYGIQQISNSSGLASFTTGLAAAAGTGTTAAGTRYGQMVLTLMDLATNTWSMQGQWANIGDAVMNQAAGIKALAGTLDRVRLTTVNGTDTFDAGSVNILYE
jgi:hypothetical protein